MVYLFFYFCKIKGNYYTIINEYLSKNFSFGAAYHFHSLMGFFGSFGMSYYFHCLKHKRKPLFMHDENDAIYSFLEEINPKISAWIDTYYRITALAFSFILLSYFMAIIKYIFLNFILNK
ncbi:conserved protein of unknown function [Serratia sp. Tan611]|nr:conserved protein of unknown function [Serratia sp. Tan611]